MTFNANIINTKLLTKFMGAEKVAKLVNTGETLVTFSPVDCQLSHLLPPAAL